MGIPTLNRALVLEAPIRTLDGAGGYVETWQALGSLWAQVSLRSGRETSRHGTPVSETSVRITVRGAPFASDERPRPNQRFREDNRVYLIKAVAEADPRGHYLTCFATEERAL